jgi:hypothetical protein
MASILLEILLLLLPLIAVGVSYKFLYPSKAGLILGVIYVLLFFLLRWAPLLTSIELTQDYLSYQQMLHPIKKIVPLGKTLFLSVTIHATLAYAIGAELSHVFKKTGSNPSTKA